MRFKNIAISGDIGTGKSTLAKLLAEELGWKVVSTGDFFRQWHQENNIPVEETEKVPEEVDMKIDYGYQEMMGKENGIIFESRLGGWLAKDMPEVLKILCICEFEEAMKRVGTRDGETKDEAKIKARERSTKLVAKFKKLYDIDNFLDPKYFDVVVDSTDWTPKEVLEYVLHQAYPKDNPSD